MLVLFYFLDLFENILCIIKLLVKLRVENIDTRNFFLNKLLLDILIQIKFLKLLLKKSRKM